MLNISQIVKCGVLVHFNLVSHSLQKNSLNLKLCFCCLIERSSNLGKKCNSGKISNHNFQIMVLLLWTSLKTITNNQIKEFDKLKEWSRFSHINRHLY